jgi:hypothetical protein
MTSFNITEFDMIFISYDEPNAERHWADLSAKAPWAKRIHGVKGFDAAHKTAARESETDWFITVDGDNTVRPEFFDTKIEIDLINQAHECFSWNGLNAINGLAYGNGGLKLWNKNFVLAMNTHENADDPRKAVDFCWGENYRQIFKIYSDVWNNGSPYQAFRVGFREGVKLALNRGERVEAELMRHVLHPVNLRNLRIWSSVGAHVENGFMAILGTRIAWQNMCDPKWDHTVVRDYDWFNAYWQEQFEGVSKEVLTNTCREAGEYLLRKTRIDVPLLDSQESAFFREMMALRNE